MITRNHIARIHAVAATLALATILAFWVSTALSGALLGPVEVAAVKGAIVHGLWVLVPALAVTGATGFALARGRSARLIERKRSRMPWIAANGLLVLVPCALWLAQRAAAGAFDAAYLGIQAVELAAGAANLFLMAMNLRDGLRLTGRLRSPQDC